MKIRYTLELDDLVAFNQFYIDTNSPIRKQPLMFVISSVLLLTLCLLCWRYEDSLFFPISFGVLSVLFIACSWYSGRKVNIKRVAGLYSTKKNPGVLCQHELEILPDGLVDRVPVGEQKTTFQGIIRIESTATHSFVFIGTLLAHIIPHAKVTEGDVDSFVATLKQKWQTERSSADTNLRAAPEKRH